MSRITIVVGVLITGLAARGVERWWAGERLTGEVRALEQEVVALQESRRRASLLPPVPSGARRSGEADAPRVADVAGATPVTRRPSPTRSSTSTGHEPPVSEVESAPRDAVTYEDEREEIAELMEVPEPVSGAPRVHGLLLLGDARRAWLERPGNGVVAWAEEGERVGRWQVVHVDRSKVIFLHSFPVRDHIWRASSSAP